MATLSVIFLGDWEHVQLRFQVSKTLSPKLPYTFPIQILFKRISMKFQFKSDWINWKGISWVFNRNWMGRVSILFFQFWLTNLSPPNCFNIIQNGKPHILYLSVHNFGAYYSWDESTNKFYLTKGETPKQKVINSCLHSEIQSIIYNSFNYLIVIGSSSRTTKN